MPSLKQTLASRANGARSRGPMTPEGKRRSSRNAARRGLLARFLVLDEESREGFHHIVGQHFDRLQPADGLEAGLMEEMAAAYWRLRRVWAIETRLLENQIAAGTETDQLNRIASGFHGLAESRSLELLHRYETRLHCMYQRALHNFLLLRASGPAPQALDLAESITAHPVGLLASPAHPAYTERTKEVIENTDPPAENEPGKAAKTAPRNPPLPPEATSDPEGIAPHSPAPGPQPPTLAPSPNSPFQSRDCQGAVLPNPQPQPPTLAPGPRISLTTRDARRTPNA